MRWESDPADSRAGGPLLRGAAGVLAANLAGAALAFGAQVILARWLGTSQYGVYIYALTWVSLLGIVALRGTDTATLHFVATYAGQGLPRQLATFLRFARRRALASSLMVASALALVVAALGLRLSPEATTAFWIAALLLIPNTALQVRISALQALGSPGLAQALQGIARPVALLALTAAILQIQGQPIQATAVLLGNGAACLLVLAIAAGRLSRAVRAVRPIVGGAAAPPPAEPRQWKAVSASMLGIAVCQALISQADLLLLGVLVGTEQAGIYAAAARMASLVAFGVVSVDAVLAPRIADLHARGRHAELQTTITLAARATFAWAACSGAILIVLARPILAVFGSDFAAAAPILVLLTVPQLVIAANGPVGFLLSMTGHQREALFVAAGGAALTIVLSLVLIHGFGAWGAAFATLLATGGRGAALSILVRRRLGIRASAFGW